MSGHLICIGSLPASGKTTVADKLTVIMNASAKNEGEVISLCPDKLRLRILGKNPETDSLVDSDITPETTQQVIALMKQQAEQGLEQGKTVIIGSSFILEDMRNDYQAAAEGLGAKFTGLWLDVSYETRRERALKRAESAVNGSAVVSDRVLKAEVQGVVDWHTINAEQSVDNVVADALSFIKRDQRAGPA